MSEGFRRMVLSVYFFFFFFFWLADNSVSGECPRFFDCGNLGKLSFPLTTPQHKDCGMLPIHGCEISNAEKTAYLGKKKFQVTRLDYFKNIVVRDADLQKHLVNNRCDAFCCNITLPRSSALGSFYIFPNMTFYKCKSSLNYSLSKQFFNYTGCGKSNNETIFFGTQDQDDLPSPLATCPRVQLPVKMLAFSSDPFTFIASEFSVQIQLSPDCGRCLFGNGPCRLNSTGGFYCSKFKGGAIGSVVVIIIGFNVILLRKKRRQKPLGSKNQSRSIEYDTTHTNATLESRNIYFEVPVFSYEELEEATNKFDPARQLGRGGFGTVYYGKLKDGREVAVKLLFERNHRGVEQFKNEVKILTRLRHRNLVSLYGCTSRASRELLLVYEYISNGTLGCHLHGNLAKPGSLPWPVRMRIAIETANALSYLHACGIIHRDVKSNNLLLEEHFCVKVADFGISRLFPKVESHVSTAPAGTPGYLDPEYYQFCQLTQKSDVYSFGVVLVELISSKPAIFTRATDKVNLANLAVKKIQRGAFSELVDPSLGFESDDEVKEMIISVAKLAFQCLQREGELRPSMDEVMEFLQKIENGNHDLKHMEFHGAGVLNREIYTSLPTSIHWNEVGSSSDSKPQHYPRTA